MKLIFVVLACLVSVSAFAEEHHGMGGPEGGNFEAHKKEMLQMIDARMSAVTKLKACVQSASNHEAVKACHEQEHSDMMAMEKQKMDERIKEMQTKRAQMDQQKTTK